MAKGVNASMTNQQRMWFNNIKDDYGLNGDSETVHVLCTVAPTLKTLRLILNEHHIPQYIKDYARIALFAITGEKGGNR